METQDDPAAALEQRLVAIVHELERVLPAQAPIRDFVHHNTLHGFQHLPFPDALRAARERLGVRGYPSLERFRAWYAAGRIDDEDIDVVLRRHGDDPDGMATGFACTRIALWRAALLGRFDESGVLPRRVAVAVEDGPTRWRRLEAKVGAGWTLRDLLRHLTGEDAFEVVRGGLIRQIGAWLDLGIAPWEPRRDQGFYAFWRVAAASDFSWNLAQLPDARRELVALPERAADAAVQELGWLGLPLSRWQGYLERMALELPGWSGMFLWRAEHEDYRAGRGVPVAMLDYLAVRLALERVVTQDIIRRHFGLVVAVPVLARLGQYFAQAEDELRVRDAYGAGRLDERGAGRVGGWLARLAAGGQAPEWRGALAHIQDEQRFEMPPELAHLDTDRMSQLWLEAYERHYRQRIFAALAANHGRWHGHEHTPAAQLVFCMDDREEGMRRHLEEIAPAVETLGAAAHFGVFQSYTGLDDKEPTALCPVVPVVVKPAHAVNEVPRPGMTSAAERHASSVGRRRVARRTCHEDMRRNPLTAALIAVLGAPMALTTLLARAVAPGWAGTLAARWRAAHDGAVPTQLDHTAPDQAPPATSEMPRAGFTETEQAERIGNFLRAMGLTTRFAPLVAIVGHGSNSANNPHLSAYDCGACAGRHSGPNARLFAAMANRPGVRLLLAERGLAIPETTWFLGAEHNTCDDGVTWFDLEDLPSALQPAFAALDRQLAAASSAHARERCRRLASAPATPTPEAALRHVVGRRHDFSQARPELGHATNACALIGRRGMSRGAFFDRRAFLISYDPTQDADGAILERLLLANGPVGAGIALEYYFSTADNERFGCGTKIVHNVTGLHAVMEGANSDLRTGLPKQMVEIHEPMRLLVVVEQTTDVVGAIYARQPALRELIGNAWIVVAAKHPESARIDLFDPQCGWLRWDGKLETATRAASADWFAGKREALAPALLERPLRRTA